MTIERIPPAAAQERMETDGYVYLDVRSVPEFDGGHPAGAYNIPLLHLRADRLRPNEAFVAEVEAVFSKDTPIVLGCRSGRRSLDAAGRLTAAGFVRVVDQRAGFTGTSDAFGRTVDAGWEATGLPVAYEAQAGRSYADLTAPE